MRIVVWNMRGCRTRPHEFELATYFARWQADVVVLLEPATYLREHAAAARFGGTPHVLRVRPAPTPANLHPGPVPSEWRVVGHFGGQAQGHVVIAYHHRAVVGVACVGHQVARVTPNNDLVILTITPAAGVGATMPHYRVATCHAPFGGADNSATVFLAAAAQRLAPPPRGIGPVDIWAGDLNTYTGDGLPRIAQGQYTVRLAQPTSGFGANGRRSAPLDKVLVRAGLVIGTAGRVGPAAPAAGPVGPPGPGGAPGAGPGLGAALIVSPVGGASVDLPEPTWRSAREVPSDHIPIYFDIDGGPVAIGLPPLPLPGGAPAAAGPPAAPGPPGPPPGPLGPPGGTKHGLSGASGGASPSGKKAKHGSS